jgi:hypothetical protein
VNTPAAAPATEPRNVRLRMPGFYRNSSLLYRGLGDSFPLAITGL